MSNIVDKIFIGGFGGTGSSFTEMQWWLGQCKPNYINMDLH